MRELYRPLFLRETPIVFTDMETSELIKYAANTFLATKITFINEIADLCENLGADVHDVAKGIGLDGRIGSKFLHPGPGYGGSCFPKDTIALVKTAQEVNSPLRIVETVIQINSKRKKFMAEKILKAENEKQMKEHSHDNGNDHDDTEEKTLSGKDQTKKKTKSTSKKTTKAKKVSKK